MAKEKKSVRPTDAELAVLRVLWRRGPSTVRDVQDELEPDRGTGYTTTLKIMQIMFEKGLVLRNAKHRTHVYEAAVSRTKTQRQIIGQLLQQLFDGSSPQLVLQALATKKATAEELAEIRQLLDQLDGGKP